MKVDLVSFECCCCGGLGIFRFNGESHEVQVRYKAYLKQQQSFFSKSKL